MKTVVRGYISMTSKLTKTPKPNPNQKVWFKMWWFMRSLQRTHAVAPFLCHNK